MKKKAKFTPEYIESQHKAARDIIESMAKQASEEISNFYHDEIDYFYKEYTPFLYVRHHDRGEPHRGMDLTYETIFEEMSKGDLVSFKGGINISTDRMYSDYSGTQEQVLYSFLAGYHGLPPFHKPRTEIEKRRNDINLSIHPITPGDYYFYSSNVHPLKDTRNFIRYVLEPKLRKQATFKD